MSLSMVNFFKIRESQNTCDFNQTSNNLIERTSQQLRDQKFIQKRPKLQDIIARGSGYDDGWNYVT